MSIANLRTFEIGLDEEKKLVEKTVGTVVRKIGIDALRGIVLMTPVDTGRARGNWQVTINATIDGVTDRRDPGGGGAIAEGSAAILATPPFAAIYLQNNLPYIVKLEEGSSKQAPVGMVEVTLDRIFSAFRS